MSKYNYYCVRLGHNPGIYKTWKEAEKEIKDYKGAIYKEFQTKDEAEYYMNTGKEYYIDYKNIIKIKNNDALLDKTQKTLFNCNSNKKPSVVQESKKKNEETEKSKPKLIRIWTDGSSINNGKNNCKAGYAVFFSNKSERNTCGKITKEPSNQKAELKAILKAIELIKENEKAYIYTDSKYSIQCITEWSLIWRLNNWKTKNGSDVKHQDIIKEILKKMKKVNVKFIHIKSHQKKPENKNSLEYKIWYGNNMADKLAKSVIK